MAREIKKWKKWHDSAMNLALDGKKETEIAELLGKSWNSVYYLFQWEVFNEKFDKVIMERRKNAFDLLNKYKFELLKKKISFALHKEKVIPLHIQNEAMNWLMERFPEFKKEFEKTQVNVYQPSSKDVEKYKETVEDFKVMMEFLAKGNPNVVEPNEGGANERDINGRTDRPETERPEVHPQSDT